MWLSLGTEASKVPGRRQGRAGSGQNHYQAQALEGWVSSSISFVGYFPQPSPGNFLDIPMGMEKSVQNDLNIWRRHLSCL